MSGKRSAGRSGDAVFFPPLVTGREAALSDSWCAVCRALRVPQNPSTEIYLPGNLADVEREFLADALDRRLRPLGGARGDAVTFTMSSDLISSPDELRRACVRFLAKHDDVAALVSWCYQRGQEHAHALVVGGDKHDWNAQWSAQTGAHPERGLDVRPIHDLRGWLRYMLQPRDDFEIPLRHRLHAVRAHVMPVDDAITELEVLVHVRDDVCVPWRRARAYHAAKTTQEWCKGCNGRMPDRVGPLQEYCSTQCGAATRKRTQRYRDNLIVYVALTQQPHIAEEHPDLLDPSLPYLYRRCQTILGTDPFTTLKLTLPKCSVVSPFEAV